MKTKLFTFFALLIFVAVFSQKKSRGDRFFENGDFLNAITEYQKDLENKKFTKHNFENLATSYYNTYQFRQAYRYLKTLLAGKFTDSDKTYENGYNFKMHQVLSALGEYDKSLDYLILYQKSSSQAEINKDKAIAVIEDFKLKDDDYKIKAVLFNSEASEFGAVKLDSAVYFTSDRQPNSILEQNYKWTHRPFLNIYKVKVTEKNKPVSEVESISDQINSNLHEGNFCFSPDAKTLYISKSNTEKNSKVFDSLKNNAIHLYKSVKDSLGNWSKPEKLAFSNPNYSIMHPTMNADGSKLYFASNMPGGYGNFDIYYVDCKEEEGGYGNPVNLGDKINTANREQFPFLSKKGNLFFSSNGHLGLGMMDIFVSETDQNKFEKPINLGAPINSSYDDFSLSYYNETDGFFTSNRLKANDDIYKFRQIGEIFPKNYKAIFEVRDNETKEFITDASVVLTNSDGKIVFEDNVKNGAFEKEILTGKYTLNVVAENYQAQEKLFLVKEKNNEVYITYLIKKPIPVVEVKIPVKLEEQKGEQLLETLKADKTGPPVVEKNGKLFFELPPIYFDYDKWTIRADSKKVLNDFAVKLEKYKTIYIKIGSHTDSRGSESYNQLLSERRAESTRNYLALVGYVNARRIEFKGYGESQPVVDCKDKVCSEQEHQNNRRSEFEIVKY